ncbi:MAG: sensor histidine kinase [Solirubrobacteraceae bacterium]|nr:sensor histidine kinase [Solirubrobacteraceae bacterium]
MARIAAWARRHGLDLLIVLAAIGGAVEVLLRDGAQAVPSAIAAPLVAALVLMLLGRRRWPFAAPAALWLGAAGMSFADGDLAAGTVSVYAAGMASAFLLGNLRDEVQGRLGLVIAAGASAIIVVNQPDHATSDIVAIPAVFVLAWLAGLALRERSVQAEDAEERVRFAERERETVARIAVAEERARIARELHDIVAHSISVMVLQVGAVRHRLPDDRAEHATALQRVEQTGRTALNEMRRLLGAMRLEDDDAELAPQPGLEHLEMLLEEVRRAGLPVELEVDGAPVPLPGAIDLSAYRIVQEGLTNTLKHADAGRARVVLRYGADEFGIDVSDDGRGNARSGPVGHGLIGVRERVKIFGGDMSAGAGEDGGFLLRTRLPLTGTRG